MIFLLGTGLLLKIAATVLGTGAVALGGDCLHSCSKKELKRIKREEEENK